MDVKLLAPLLGSRLEPARRFPRLRLKPLPSASLSSPWQPRASVPLDHFEDASVAAARREFPPGQLLEIRRADDALLGVAAFEPGWGRVDLLLRRGRGPPPSALPLLDEGFFLARVDAAAARRRAWRDPPPFTNAHRLANGPAEGLPGLFLDRFAEAVVRVVATTAFAGRLLPAVAEALRGRRAERLLLRAPALEGGGGEVRLVGPTLPLPEGYVEGGVRLPWPRPGGDAAGGEDGAPREPRLANPAHRRARRLLRELSRGRRVVILHDDSGAAAGNAVMRARHVRLAASGEAVLAGVRATLQFNHGTAGLERCAMMDLSKMRGWRELVAGETGAPEVVFVEHHPRELSTAWQWREFLTAAFAEGVIGVGTFLITAQEADPLGIPDLSVGKAPGATRREMEEAILDSAESCQLRARILRTFTSSWDFPVLPEEEPSCFSHVCLIEESGNS